MMQRTNFVLVPGAWHGGWAWEPVAKRLRALGHRVTTLTLPGLGDGSDPRGLELEDAIESVVAALVRETDQVTLVGHSWGGYPMVGAMHRMRQRVAGAIFYNALIPVPGRSMVDDTAPLAAQMLRDQSMASPNGAIALPEETVAQLYLQDADPGASRLLAELLLPQPRGYFFDAYEGPDAVTLGIPLAYIRGEADRVMHFLGVDFATRLHVEPIVVPGSHDGLLTHPSPIAQAILAIRGGMVPRGSPRRDEQQCPGE